MSDFYDSIETNPKLFNQEEQKEVDAYVDEMKETESKFMARMSAKMIKRAKKAQEQLKEGKKKR